MRLPASLIRNVAAAGTWLVHEEERELKEHGPRWLLTTLAMIGVFTLAPLLFIDLYIFPIAFTVIALAVLSRLIIYINVRRKRGAKSPARDGATGPLGDYEAESPARRENRPDNAH